MRSRLTSGIMLTFLLMVTLTMTVGGALSSGLMAHSHNMHEYCPLTEAAVLCTMNPLEHLGMMQSMLSAVSHASPVAILLVLLSLAWQFVRRLLTTSPPLALPLFHYRYSELIISPLQLAFARGLINPKVY